MQFSSIQIKDVSELSRQVLSRETFNQSKARKLAYDWLCSIIRMMNRLV